MRVALPTSITDDQPLPFAGQLLRLGPAAQRSLPDEQVRLGQELGVDAGVDLVQMADTTHRVRDELGSVLPQRDDLELPDAHVVPRAASPRVTMAVELVVDHDHRVGEGDDARLGGQPARARGPDGNRREPQFRPASPRPAPDRAADRRTPRSRTRAWRGRPSSVSRSRVSSPGAPRPTTRAPGG